MENRTVYGNQTHSGTILLLGLIFACVFLPALCFAGIVKNCRITWSLTCSGALSFTMPDSGYYVNKELEINYHWEGVAIIRYVDDGTPFGEYVIDSLSHNGESYGRGADEWHEAYNCGGATGERVTYGRWLYSASTPFSDNEEEKIRNALVSYVRTIDPSRETIDNPFYAPYSPNPLSIWVYTTMYSDVDRYYCGVFGSTSHYDSSKDWLWGYCSSFQAALNWWDKNLTPDNPEKTSFSKKASYPVGYLDTPRNTVPIYNHWDIKVELSEKPDLILDKIDNPVQVIYDCDINDDGKTDLVHAKNAVVAVYVDIKNPESLEPGQKIEIQAKCGTTVKVVETTASQIANDPKVLINFCPMDLDASELEVMIDPNDSIEETKEDNNELSTGVSIKQTTGLRLAFVPIDVPSAGVGYGPINMPLYVSTSENSARFILPTFPVAEGGFSKTVSMNKMTGSVFDPANIDKAAMKDCLDVWARGQALNNASAAVGIVPGDYFAYHGNPLSYGWMYQGITAGVIAGIDTYSVAAHEVGHSFGLRIKPNPEEYDLFISVPMANKASGIWVNDENREVDGYCFMGNAADYVYEHWIDDECYRNLFLNMLENPSDPEILLIGGCIHLDGHVELYTFSRLKNAIADGNRGEGYSVVMLGRYGNIISVFPFYTDFVAYKEPIGQVSTNIAGFGLAVALPEGVVKLQIQQNGIPLIEVDPNIELLQHAIDAVPDHGIVPNHMENRKALHAKVAEIEVKIKAGLYRDAINKLKHDLKDKLMKWLVDGYQVENALQMTKEEVIKLVDETIARLSKLL